MVFENLGGIAAVGFNLFLIVFGVLFLLLVGCGIFYFYWLQYKRYKQYKVIVLERDGVNNLNGYEDDGAIFVKEKNKRLWLRKSNISLPADNLPYINIGKEKYIYLIKKGTKNYLFAIPTIDENGISFKVGEEDLNWAIIAFNHSTTSFSQTLLAQAMPYMLGMFALLVVLVVCIMLIKKIDTMVEIVQLMDVRGAISQSVV